MKEKRNKVWLRKLVLIALCLTLTVVSVPCPAQAADSDSKLEVTLPIVEVLHDEQPLVGLFSVGHKVALGSPVQILVLQQPRDKLLFGHLNLLGGGPNIGAVLSGDEGVETSKLYTTHSKADTRTGYLLILSKNPSVSGRTP